jgi:hypothetical protein
MKSSTGLLLVPFTTDRLALSATSCNAILQSADGLQAIML